MSPHLHRHTDAPGVGPAGIPEVVPEQQRLEPVAAGVEVLEGVFAGAGQVADRLIADLEVELLGINPT